MLDKTQTHPHACIYKTPTSMFSTLCFSSDFFIGVLLLMIVIALSLWLLSDRLLPADRPDINTSTLPVQRCVFDYGPQHGPHTWPQHFRAAAIGSGQSPINIDTGRAVVTPLRQPIVWYDYERSPRAYRLHNTGTGNLELWPTHTGAQSMDPVPTIGSAGCTPNAGDTGNRPACSYEFRFLSVHWPAEHTVDNRRFQLELQAMHVLDAPATTGTDADAAAAVQAEDSSTATLAVSYMFGVTPEATNNPYLQLLVDRLPAIREAGTYAEMDGFPLAWLCAPLAEHGFYDYAGSWTVPPCTETVTWLVSRVAGTVSAGQLDQFRKLRSSAGESVWSNARPVQSLNGRTVHLNTLLDDVVVE